MPKIFALRDRLMEVQQSLFSHEENERTKGNSDNNFSSSSSKLFGLNLLHFDSMFDQPPMTSSFHIEHKHPTPEEGKIGTPKTYVHTSILNTPKKRHCPVNSFQNGLLKPSCHSQLTSTFTHIAVHFQRTYGG